MKRSKKPLHFAQSVESLEKLAKAGIVDQFSQLSFLTLMKLQRTIFETLSNEHFDEELAFIYCLRFLHIIQKMTKLDEDFTRNRFRSECTVVHARIEQLRSSLSARYADLAAVMVLDPADSHRPPKPEATVLFLNSFISPRELYAAMKTYNDLLIVDLRTSEEFLESKIKYANLISIPCHLITKGLSANKLGEILPPEARRVWEKRDQYRAIIIVDYSIKNPNSNEEPFAILRSILVNWDINRQYNEHPTVLEGGFHEFAETYPTEVENGYLCIRVKYMELNEIMDDVADIRVKVSRKSSGTETSTDDSDSLEVTFEDAEEGGSDTTLTADEAAEVEPEPKPSRMDDLFEPRSPPAPEVKPANKQLDNEIDNMKLTIQKNLNLEVNEIRKYKPMIAPTVDRRNKPEEPPAEQASGRDELAYGLTGIKNIRNNCFMSAILQCVRVLPMVKAFFLSDKCRDIIASRNCVVLDEVTYMINALWSSSGSALDPTSFRIRMIQLNNEYRYGNHEDAMEFFSLLLNRIESDTASRHPREPNLDPIETAVMAMKGSWSIFTDFFYYVIEMNRTCPSCGHKSIAYECENTLMLSVPEDRNTSLYDLSREYVKDSVLHDFKCENCDSVVDLFVSKEVKTYPKTFVINLKRYHQTSKGCVKSNVEVTFPPTSLILYGYKYDLYAVLCHKGTLNTGHYYALCKLYVNRWYEMNDDLVQPTTMDDQRLIYKEACAFFYQRNGTVRPSPNSSQL